MQRGEREDGLNDVPVVDLTTERRRRRSRWTWIGSAGIVVVALAVAIPIVAARNNGHDPKTGGGRHPRRPDRRTAITDVRASIAFTGSARSYDFRGTFTPDAT